MIGEIIAIGDELTSGRIQNTTSRFAARHLFEAGYDIYAMHTIGDTPPLIGEALQRAIKRVDFVIVTGGLGTTDDDMTNEAVSKALNRPTMPNLQILSLIREQLDEHSPSISSQLEKLAWLPRGANPLNPQARMSGYLLEYRDKPIFFLPGVPSQMKQLLIEHVLPRLLSWHSGKKVSSSQRLFKIFGLTEMEVNQKILSLKLPEQVHIGYYPMFPELHLSLTVRNLPGDQMYSIFHDACSAIENNLGNAVFGYDRDTIESVVGTMLLAKKKWFATAESCTGGLISHKITSVPGSSAYFLGGITSYSNSLKTNLLGVKQSTIDASGAVSEEVATSMAQGICVTTGADIGIAVTGIAGPDGGTEEKPVGTVFISLAAGNDCLTKKFCFSGDRLQIQEITTQTALDLVRLYLLQTS